MDNTVATRRQSEIVIFVEGASQLVAQPTPLMAAVFPLDRLGAFTKKASNECRFEKEMYRINAKFEAEVVRKSERNERIATKPRRPLLDQMRTQHISHAYASKRGRHAQKAVSAHMRTRRMLAWVRIKGFHHL
ncbi:hypothetical protein PIB30_035938 [Stylosanthes scabra]|uniref:Uncharacterized protein n=1 Tax=Stylosanthes scabra TaxID=79078 RepID=A0ABU6ZBV8_9FABA|nr:hypothetical protein [Stylosanthes scabra]